ncbi:FecCD family ABC transporter permease [Boseongicola aestuarii]|uniref:Hemin transport system permease protein HmuU n=1 Tax=Boseongicola aestuarii TaxID=1470561 RepID=A0A238J287_9RHOB|nr:iron ABC transporter permease [Boseongicola aestuarii]SMX24818.1 Hemin transport system permease protein HmuU [Boseongicola aestuarii]
MSSPSGVCLHFGHLEETWRPGTGSFWGSALAVADETTGRSGASRNAGGFIVVSGLCALVVFAFAISLITGPSGMTASRALSALFFDSAGPETVVMREIRLPRAVLGAFVGAALGLSGAAMQGLLRNPLAEPGLIGVSATAALGAVIALQTGLAAAFALALPLFALVGAGIAVGLLLLLAGPRGTSLVLILAGIAISALAAAGTSLVLNLSPNPFAASEIVFWLMGSLADRSWTHVWLAAPLIALGGGVLFLTGRGLDALTLGEDAAEALGVRIARLRLMVVAGTALAVGAATAVTGAIGFVGLVVPHILRPLTGGLPSRLLPASALGGAAMVLLADSAAQGLLPDRDLKLGVLTAFIGAPVFLHLIFRTRRAGV